MQSILVLLSTSRNSHFNKDSTIHRVDRSYIALLRRLIRNEVMRKFLTTVARKGGIKMLLAFVRKAGFIFGGSCRATLDQCIISSLSVATFISSINPREVIKLNDPRSLSIIPLVSAYLFRHPSMKMKASPDTCYISITIYKNICCIQVFV